MKKLILFPVIYGVIFTITFNSCSKSPRCWGSDKNKGIIKESVVINCFPATDKHEIVINDEAALKAIFDSTCVLPSIDFSSSTLLGLYASGGCEVKFIRQVERKDGGKIHYSIKVKECGFCKVLGFSYNWVTVPKIENAEDVSFEVK
ncbi:hypothetical protein CNR22_11625 [Sphingobacteriaceae bacterium]|nr:hypothetical protein CNR22_11625 [Sphingobacteriaceae bacterium]